MAILNKYLLSHAAMAAVALFYGINYFTLKPILNEGYDNFGLVAIRCFVGLIVFVTFHAIFIKEKIRDKKDYGTLALCALFGITINQEFFVWGMANTEKVNASVLMITTPLFVLIGAWLLKEESITRRKIVGMIIAFAGALSLILVNFKGEFSISTDTLKGDVMITINAMSYGVYLVLARPLADKYNAFTVIKWIFIFGSIPNILIGAKPALNMDFAMMSDQVIFALIWLVLFATVLAYLLNAWAMKNMPSTAVGVYIFFQPVFVTTLSAIFDQGKVTPLKLIFILLVLIGVAVATSRKKASLGKS